MKIREVAALAVEIRRALAGTGQHAVLHPPASRLVEERYPTGQVVAVKKLYEVSLDDLGCFLGRGGGPLLTRWIGRRLVLGRLVDRLRIRAHPVQNQRHENRCDDRGEQRARG